MFCRLSGIYNQENNNQLWVGGLFYLQKTIYKVCDIQHNCVEEHWDTNRRQISENLRVINAWQSGRKFQKYKLSPLYQLNEANSRPLLLSEGLIDKDQPKNRF